MAKSFYIKKDDKVSKICVFYTKFKRTNQHSIFFFNNYFFKTYCILILVIFLIHTCNKQRSHCLTPHILQHKLWNLNKFPHHQYYLFKFYKKKTTSLPLSFSHSLNTEPSPPTSLPNVEAFTSHLSLLVSHLKPFSLHCFHNQQFVDK